MKEKKFKYAEQLDLIPNCPPEENKEVNLTAYRFVHSNLNHPSNFSPVKILMPKRKFRNKDEECLALGLSMFNDKTNAVSFFKTRMTKYPALVGRTGNHIATISISENDGVSSHPESQNFGHFTFHEYLWNNFKTKVISTEPINIE